MIIPRWTVYPALGLLIGMPMAVVFKGANKDPYAGAAARASAAPVLPETTYPRLVFLGIDGLDPDILNEAIDRFPERTKNFQWLASRSGIASLGTATPPQSPVAWSNFITGYNPGGHGIFDFLHRDPMTRGPLIGTLTPSTASNFDLWGDWKFPLPGEGGDPNRSGQAFWTTLMDAGVPASVWRMPINIPPEPSMGVSIPGMLTPALDSAYGECTVFTNDPLAKSRETYKKLVIMREEGDGKFAATLEGPPNPYKKGDPHSKARLVFYVDEAAGHVAVDTGSEVAVIAPGEWSDFLGVSFDMQLPDFGSMDATGIVRFYLRKTDPVIELYASAVNIDPEAPIMDISAPGDASAELAKEIGRYYTQGMAEDVNALKSELLSVDEFADQENLVYNERVRMLDHALDSYIENEDGGFLFFYFSTVDLTSHMLWRHADEDHPDHDPAIAAGNSEHFTGREGSSWKDITLDVILKIDPVLGKLRARLGDETPLVVMSDHGFAPYHREFSLNTWLLENGYLVLKDPEVVKDEDGNPVLDDDGNQVIREYSRELAKTDPAFKKMEIMSAVDWSKTRAYGMGFNGLYINLKGRELDNPATEDVDESGIVEPGAEHAELVSEIKAKLEKIIDPKNGKPVILHADRPQDIYTGDRISDSPDLLVGFNYGYGNSDPSSAGRIPVNILQDNMGGTFAGSHLMAPEVVAGTLASNLPLREGDHRLEDLTVEILKFYGLEPNPKMQGHPVLVHSKSN